MPALWCSDLFKRFRPRLRLDDLLRGRLRPKEPPLVALDGVSFSVEEGEMVALLGANGAGKTTLLKTVASWVVPGGGEAMVAGHALSQEIDVRRSIGLVTSEERSFYWRLTGRENLAFFAAMHGLDSRQLPERLRELSAAFQLEPFIDRRFDACSSGMKQRLALPPPPPAPGRADAQRRSHRKPGAARCHPAAGERGWNGGASGDSQPRRSTEALPALSGHAVGAFVLRRNPIGAAGSGRGNDGGPLHLAPRSPRPGLEGNARRRQRRASAKRRAERGFGSAGT